jgi:hypothetical protein
VEASEHPPQDVSIGLERVDEQENLYRAAVIMGNLGMERVVAYETPECAGGA